MDNVKLDQLNWTAIGFLTQTTLLVLALIDVDLVRFLIFRLGLLLVLVGAGFFFLVKNGRRSRLWLAGLLLKHQDKILGGTSKLFTLTPTKVAMVYFGILQRLVAKPKLWELQPIIPKLPVPPLSQTCATYLKTVKPLLSEEQFETTSRVVADFQTPGGIGQQLHGALVARYNDPNIDNWLEEMWETFAYLRIRDALPLSSNWYGVDRPHPTAHDKISRAANTAAAILSFKEMVDAEDLDPVLLYNAVPLCMEQYRRMFNSARIPMEPFDRIYHKPEARHIVVVYQGQMFNFKAYNANGTPLSRDQLAAIFQNIVTTVDNTPVEERVVSLGALTAQDRSTWAKYRGKLIADGNTEQLEIIESAILLLALESEAPDTLQDLADRAAKGNPDNRWYDKCGTFIFWDNGRLSTNVEHTWGDAPVMVNLVTYIFGVEDTKSPLAPAGSAHQLPVPNLIRFNLSEEVLAQIQVAKEEYQVKVVDNGVELSVLEFDQFGKNLIKNAKLSPDGFVQMALQLAYYTKYGKLCLTYESSHTRIFRKGRTETVRSASSDALAYVQSMHDPDAGDFQRILLLRKAVNSHIAYMRQAMSGNGVDRHLMGMYVAAFQMGLVGEKTPALFRDAGYQLSYQLSTSQTPGYQTGGGGFNPTDLNGYGASYVVNEDSLVFHISSWKTAKDTSSVAFASSLSEALMAMRAVLLTDSQMRRNLSHSKLVQMAQLEAD